MNHFPIFARQAPSQCSDGGDTANPFDHITCPACRARLEAKRDSHAANAAAARKNSEEFRFETGCAQQWQNTLDGKDVVVRKPAPVSA